MENNLNLCELLKGHEGETFYSTLCGYIELNSVNKDSIFFKNKYGRIVTFTKSGNYFFYECPDTECLVFPSKEQRDWNKWVGEQKIKAPKTWSEIKHCNAEVWQAISNMDYGAVEPIVKSAIALLKIRQLIEAGYGGNVTKEEWEDVEMKKYYASILHNKPTITETFSPFHNHIAFRSKEKIDEFMSFPENIQLVYDFYMIEP